MALSSFEGALLLVSHDRHLLRATCDQLWLVHDGTLAEFDGDLDDYTALVLASRREDQATAPAAAEGGSRREQRKQAAEARQKTAGNRKPLQQKLGKVEAELAGVTAQLRELDARLAEPDFYHAGDAAEVAAALKRRGELAEVVDALEARWLKLTEELEAMP